MDYGFLSCVPTLVLIIGIMCTKRMMESLVVSTLLGAILVYRQNFLTGYVDLMFQALANPSFHMLIIGAVCFGGMIYLLERSGAMLGFRKLLERFCTNGRRTMVLTWLLGAVVFIDDYLNALAVSVSMKGVSDHYRLPREHLAYTVNCMGACVCVMIPVSSWAVFAMSTLGQYGLDASAYYRAIPMMFYPICAIVICFLVAVRKFPLLGAMKEAYQRVEAGGSVMPDLPDGSASQLDADETIQESSAWNFLLPMIALVATMLLCGNNIAVGMMVALALMLVMYRGQKLMTIREFSDGFVAGGASTAPLLLDIGMTFILQAANEQMGFTNYLVQLFSQHLSPALLPAIAFVMVAFTAFMAASFWPLILITFPIFVPLAIEMQINPSLVIAAIMSGVALGSQACVYGDAVFMVATGTGVPNAIQVRAIMPYVLTGAALATALFLGAGFLL